MPRPATPTRRSRRLAVVAALAAATLSACGNAQTDAQYQPAVGANVRSGSIQLFNALAVRNDDGTATVSATIINRSNRSVRLTSASGRLSDGTKLTATVTPAIISPGKPKDIGPAGSVMLEGKSELIPGYFVKLTLNFSGGLKAAVDAPIVAPNSMYDDVAPGPGGETTTGEPGTEPEEAPAAH